MHNPDKYDNYLDQMQSAADQEIGGYEEEIKKLNISISDLEQLLMSQSRQIEQFWELLYQAKQGMDEYWMEQNPEIVKEIRTILEQ